ncbi:MAG TPA: glycine cleavage system aminomethyltransferase GcvT [Acidimicrobiia bacterium]|nr:glycine cleavage system aminomethyltransferase GcvT [Acidimicrobiia bacterium]
MNRSPLADLHHRLGARFVGFGGWEMPVQYESVLAEHKAVRVGLGVFDVSHLGRFELSGPGAHDALVGLFCNDIERVSPGRTQYTMMLNPSGGIVDDLIVWWWEPDRFWVMPNAANQGRVMAAFSAEPGCVTRGLREDTVLLAVQGPTAPETMTSVLGTAPARFRCMEATWNGEALAMAGTGYTGERGGEIVCDPPTGRRLFEALLESGATPCGLGARDTLRLEAGLPLWGQDLDETTTPLEANLGFAVAMDHVFVGKEILAEQSERGVPRRLTGLVLDERGIPRHGHKVRTADGTGVVTSGNLSPMLDRGVALAYLLPPPGPTETFAEIEIRSRWVPATIRTPPFHQQLAPTPPVPT